MTTLVAKAPPALAKGVACAADLLGMTHEQVVLEAVRLLVRSVAPKARKRVRKKARGRR